MIQMAVSGKSWEKSSFGDLSGIQEGVLID